MRHHTRMPKLLVYLAINPGVVLTTKQLGGLLDAPSDGVLGRIAPALDAGWMELVSRGRGAGRPNTYGAGDRLHEWIAEAHTHARALAAARPEAAP